MEIKTGHNTISIFKRGIFQMGLRTDLMDKNNAESVLLFYAVEEIERLKLQINHLKQELAK